MPRIAARHHARAVVLEQLREDRLEDQGAIRCVRLLRQNGRYGILLLAPGAAA
jgi:hypothetical protein